MRWVLLGLTGVLLLLQYRLWFAEGGIGEQVRLERQIAEQQDSNEVLRERNVALEREVLELQSGHLVVEQRARNDLGLVKQGEIYYQFSDSSGKPDRP